MNYLDENGLSHLWLLLKEKFNGKVNAEEGKGLSSNDYTDDEKAKLAGIEDGANNYELPKASATELGGVKIGANLSIDEDGVLSANAQGITVDSELSSSSENPLQNKAIYAELAKKVDIVEGKELSSNDYTDEDKTKLTGIEENAQVNTIETIKVNGTELTPDEDKAVDISVPTNNNELTNGAGYQTADDVNSAIASAIGEISGVSYQIVETLPETGAKGTIYLVPNSGAGNNVYNEYIYVNGEPEIIGTTQVDLTNYVQFSDLTAITNDEIDTILAS